MTWAHSVPVRDADTPPVSTVAPVPYGQPSVHFGQLILSLEDEFARHARTRSVDGTAGRAILVHAAEKRRGGPRRAESRIAELGRLAATAGVAVVDRVIQVRDRIDPRFVLGRGRLEQVVIRAIELDAETLIFDCDLTPAQVNGVAGHTDLKVVDRTQLILDIFAQRAHTRDGKLQVELAQLKYALPRLGVRDDALSRLTGGIGGRGPGETKLEIGRRRARERLARLERELKTLSRRRAVRRARRARGDIRSVAIVGYTNAGKSTLLNTLTRAGVVAEDRLFATLDPLARRLLLPSGLPIVLSDTVGFIRDMPSDLFSAFRATFEEAGDADLLLEVVDASDSEYPEHMEAARRLLDKLSLGGTPRLLVYNKTDRLTPSERAALHSDPDAVGVCALDRASMVGLLERIGIELTRLGRRTRPYPRETAKSVGSW
jgi:GTP-binding protein HflX